MNYQDDSQVILPDLTDKRKQHLGFRDLDEIEQINARVAVQIDQNAARTREILSLEQAAS